MKTLRTLLAASVAVAVFSACGEKKPTGDIIAKKPVVKVQSSPVKMQDSKHQETVEWLGGKYTLTIARNADTSLPMITDEAGGKYYDNKISVNVARADGSVFFQKTFTKADFASQVSEKYMNKSALLGIVFDHAEDGSLVLAASVGAPDVLSDDYVPLLLTVSRTGVVSIARDTRLDGEIEE